MKTLYTKILAVTLILSFGLFSYIPLFALAAGPAAINLGSSGNFVILAKTGISTTGSTSVVGDMGLSPAAATYITGFSLILPSAGAFSTSALVTGKVYAPGYADQTPANITTAVSDMETAYTDGAGRTNPTATELGAGNIGGMTLAPGLYKWGTGVTIPTDVTISGSANDVWIFQVAQNLTVSSGAKVILSGGAQASNIFWVVAGQTTFGTGVAFNGNVLGQTAIVFNTGAILNGRALAQTAVTLDASSVTLPAGATTTPAPATTPTSTSTSTPTPTSSGSSSASGAGSYDSGTPSTTSTPASTSSLTSEQQQQYNQFISAGASPSVALNAVQQIRAVTQISTPPVYPLGQNIRAVAVNLFEGSKNTNVTLLQEFLISQNKGSAAKALGNVGATAYFGALTRAALAEFQANVGINPPLGNFGSVTREYVRTH